ncbi:MAG: hypothetical protein AB7H96_18545 [Vicinamibacterales bacterium]
MMRTVLGTVAALTLVVGLAQPSQASTTHDNRTYFTFSQPVAVPGAVLPAGEYIFRLANPDSGRSIVQVLNRETGEVHGLFFTQHAERATIANDPEVSLGEAPAGMTPSISAWWYPGSTSGREFVYAPGTASWEHAWHNDRAISD